MEKNIKISLKTSKHDILNSMKMIKNNIPNSMR